MEHVMIDLETLDNVASGVILSIGACRFDLDNGEIDDDGFYASVSIESNLARHRTMSGDTLVWWLKQPLEAQRVFHEPKQSLDSAIDAFSAWFSTGKAKYIWSNGADFDVAMLAHAYRQLGWEVPWQFWNVRCVRTYKTLPRMKDIQVVNTMKHNALSDAYAQASLVQQIHERLNANHPMVKVST